MKMKTIDPFTRRKLKTKQENWTPEEALQAALADVQAGKGSITKVIVLTIRDNQTDKDGEVMKDYTSEMSNASYLWYLEIAKVKMITEV